MPLPDVVLMIRTRDASGVTYCWKEDGALMVSVPNWCGHDRDELLDAARVLLGAVAQARTVEYAAMPKRLIVLGDTPGAAQAPPSEDNEP